MAMPTTIQRAAGIYGALLWLYPRDHRRDYGPLMVQLFRDQCEEAYARRGVRGLLPVWLRTLWDLCLTALREHLRLAADLGMANQPVEPLPWRHVLLAILPGVWILVLRAELVPWLWGWRWTWSEVGGVDYGPELSVLLYWLGQGWVYLAGGLLLWSVWRERRLARWVYPIAGLVVYGLPLMVAAFIFHQDGTTPLSPLGRLVMNTLIPLAFVAVNLGVLWVQRRCIRFSVLTWAALGILVCPSPMPAIYFAVLIALPAILGLMAASRDRLYAALFVLGLVWWFVDGLLDPSYAMLLWTDAYAATCLIASLPTLFTLILPVIWVLRARTTHQQLAGMSGLPLVGIILAEVARFLALYNTARGPALVLSDLGAGLSSAVQVAAVLALVGITYAQFDRSQTVVVEG